MLFRKFNSFRLFWYIIHVRSIFATGWNSHLVLTRISAALWDTCISGMDPIRESFKIYSFPSLIAVFAVPRLKTASICSVISTREYLGWFDLRAMHLFLIILSNPSQYLRNRAKHWAEAILCDILTSKCLKYGVFLLDINCANGCFRQKGLIVFNETFQVI